MSSQPSLVSYLINKKTTAIGVTLLLGSFVPKNAQANCLVGDPNNKNIVCTSYDFGMPVNITNSTLNPSLTVMDGNVGIGTLSPLARIDTYYAVPTGNSAANFTASKSQTTVTSASDHTGSINGVIGRTTTSNTQSGNITSTIGVIGDVSHGGSGTIEYARGLNTGISNTSTGVISNAMGINVQAPVNSGAGSIDNFYGIYLATPTAATNNFSIYSQGGKNYFGGDVEIKDTATLKVKTICDNTGSNCKDVTTGWASGGGGSGTVTSVDTGTGLTGGPITATGTIAVDVGTTANKIVQLNGSAQLPAVSGANLTNVNAATVNGQAISASSPTSGQVLSHNGTNWVNKSLGTSDISGLATALGSKLDAANMPASCDSDQTLTFTSPTGMWSCSYIAITPQVFGTQTEGMVLAAPASGNGTPTFRKLDLSDLPTGIGDTHWSQVGDYVMHTGSRVGVGVIMAPEAQFDSYYILPTLPTEDEYIANRGQAIIDATDDYEMSVIGTVGRILIQTNTSGLLNYLTGVVANVSHKGSSTIWSAIGISAGIQNRGSGTIENAYGIFVADPQNRGAGEIHTATGIYINEPTVGTDLNYSIYSTGGDNYFGGNMHVDGTLKVNQICDVDGLNCKNVAGGWSFTGNSKEVDQLRKENIELKKQIELLNQKAKLQENRLSNIEQILSSKKVARK